MARTRTPEGKFNWETKIAMGASALLLAACGYLGLRELTGSSDRPDNLPKTDPRVGEAIDSRIFGQDQVFFSNMFSSIGLEATGATGVLPISPDLASTYQAVQIIAVETRDKQPFTYILIEDQDGNVTQNFVVWLADSVDSPQATAYKLEHDASTNTFRLQEVNGEKVKMGSGKINPITGELSQLTLILPDGKAIEADQNWLNQLFDVQVAEAADLPTATPTKTSTPEPSPTFTVTPMPTPTDELTPTPAQELLFPSELSGCGSVSNVDEVLALERERFSFEKNFPSVQQVVKIEKYGAENPIDYNTLLLLPSQSEFADSPIKPVTCSRMIVDGADVYVAGLAVRNRDGSTGFLHVMIGGTDADGVAIPVFVDLPEGMFWRATKVGVEETFGAIKDGIEVIKLGYGVINRAAFLALGLKFEVNYYDNHPELFAMMEEYFITGIVPAELESIAIPLFTVRK